MTLIIGLFLMTCRALSTGTLVKRLTTPKLTRVSRPVTEALQVIRNKLQNDNTLAEQSLLQVEAIMELIEVCLRTTYFQADDKFFQQKDGMAMGSCLSPIIRNIFMEHFEKFALDSSQYKPLLWLWYVDICGLASWPRVVTEFPHPPQ
jgi:hypothetical protein